MIVDNKPGAGTVIGTDFVAKSAPDGYTVVMATFAHAVNTSLQPKLPYVPDKAFAPVALIGRSPNLLVVRADRPYKTVQDIVAFARANPGKLSYGSYGNGTSAHLAGELFKNLAKVEIVHVPYKGSSPALTDLLGGQIDLMFTTVASAAQHVEGGKLRALAVTIVHALAGLAATAHRGRGRRSRLRGRELVWPVRARRHAARSGAAPACGGACGGAIRSLPQAHPGRRPGGGQRRTRRAGPLCARRGSALAQGGAGSPHHRRLRPKT